jgi:hypothetical protein
MELNEQPFEHSWVVRAAKPFTNIVELGMTQTEMGFFTHDTYYVVEFS